MVQVMMWLPQASKTALRTVLSCMHISAALELPVPPMHSTLFLGEAWERWTGKGYSLSQLFCPTLGLSESPKAGETCIHATAFPGLAVQQVWGTIFTRTQQYPVK